jgi:putative transposase
LRTFVFKAYASKRNRKLHKQIDVASQIWNHCIALHKRYFRLFKKHLNQFQLMKHLTKLKKSQKHNQWKHLGSQAIQDIAQRIEKSYQLFFKSLKNKTARKVRPPSFRKRIKYQSFTLKQAGYAVFGNSIAVGKQQYRLFNSREIEGQIKTLTIKRDALGDIYFVIVTDGDHQIVKAATTKIAGFDFGLKDFLIESNGNRVEAPLPLKKSLKQLKKANRNLSKKKKGSNHRKDTKRSLAKLHRRIADQRKDFHFKTAAILAKQNKILCIEDLNLNGMKALWGRKVSDLGFASFVSILEHQATKTGCTVVKIDRWYPSSKTCHCCGTINQELQLRDRVWTCSCGITHARDVNAAINIQRVGMSTLGLGDVRPATMPAIAA